MVSIIQSGPAVVIDAGVVTAFMGFPLRISTLIDGVNFVVEFVFETNTEIEDVAVASEFDNGCLTIRCTNFNTATGRGSSRPVLIGETATNAVFLHFKAFLYGSTDDHTLHYTVFAADKNAIGFQPA